MEKKKTIVIASLAAAIALGFAGAASRLFLDEPIGPLGGLEGANFSLTLKEGSASFGSNYGALTFNGLTDSSSYPVAFSATSAKSASGNFAVLASGSILKNTDSITGVGSVFAVFTGMLTLQYGYTPTALSTAVSLTSGTAYSLPETMNYFVFAASDEVTLNKIIFSYSCALRPAEGDSVIEAENCTHNLTGNYKGNSFAHGGAYVGSLDNAGQGVEFTYYAYEAGTRNIDVYYTTGSVGSYHGIYVNGVYQSRFTYSTNTGWGSATAYNPASTSASVTLVKGWNTISVIKCGTASDSPSYGGWAELDYFVLHGLGQTYDPSTYSDPISYKYEAEEGYIHTDSVAPATSANASLGYIASGINVAGQGVDFNITIPAGTYQVKLSTGTTAAAVATINTDENTALNAKIALGTTTGWTDMALNANSVNVTFASSGAHTLKVTRESDSDWFTMDYVLLTPVA